MFISFIIFENTKCTDYRDTPCIDENVFMGFTVFCMTVFAELATFLCTVKMEKGRKESSYRRVATDGGIQGYFDWCDGEPNNPKDRALCINYVGGATAKRTGCWMDDGCCCPHFKAACAFKPLVTTLSIHQRHRCTDSFYHLHFYNTI